MNFSKSYICSQLTNEDLHAMLHIASSSFMKGHPAWGSPLNSVMKERDDFANIFIH